MTTNTTNDTLTIQAAVMEELTKVAAREGATVNQFVNALGAEKLAALRAYELIKERAARGDRTAISRIVATVNGNVLTTTEHVRRLLSCQSSGQSE